MEPKMYMYDHLIGPLCGSEIKDDSTFTLSTGNRR